MHTSKINRESIKVKGEFIMKQAITEIKITLASDTPINVSNEIYGDILKFLNLNYKEWIVNTSIELSPTQIKVI